MDMQFGGGGLLYDPSLQSLCPRQTDRQADASRRKFAKPEVAYGLATVVAKRTRKSQKVVNFTLIQITCVEWLNGKRTYVDLRTNLSSTKVNISHYKSSGCSNETQVEHLPCLASTCEFVWPELQRYDYGPFSMAVLRHWLTVHDHTQTCLDAKCIKRSWNFHFIVCHGTQFVDSVIMSVDMQDKARKDKRKCSTKSKMFEGTGYTTASGSKLLNCLLSQSIWRFIETRF